jgi:FkbM family methyltransferase
MQFIYKFLRLLYQPVKAITKSLGFTLIAVHNTTTPKTTYNVDIPYNKEDKNIFNNLVENIISGCKAELDDVRQDTFDLILNYRNYVDKITKVYDLLEDDFSKEIYYNLIKYRLTCSFNMMSPSITPSYDLKDPKYPIPKLKGLPLIQECVEAVYFHSQYEIPGIVEVKSDDIVFDVGAYYGDTALYFNSAVLPNGAVYAFEPNPQIAKMLKANVENNNGTNVVIVEKGLSDATIKSKFQQNEGESKVITDEKREYKIFNKYKTDDALNVQLTTIDEFIKDQRIERINFIKMDIEGHEEAAIKGAVNTIKTNKPKLAISIYHSAHDLFELPLLIHELKDDYKLYIRHAANTTTETVLFCI